MKYKTEKNTVQETLIIPFVKAFGQSVFSFKKFKATADEYEKWVIAYTKEFRMPMLFYTAAINGVFAFRITGGLLLTQNGVTADFLLNLLFYIIITPVISLTLTKSMYMSENKMIVADALQRIDTILEAARVAESGAKDALFAKGGLFAKYSRTTSRLPNGKLQRRVPCD